MGNQMWNEDDEFLQRSHPGCMSGIFHALVDYHQWQSNVKRILPHKKQDLLRHGNRGRSQRITWIENDSLEVKKLLDAEANQPHIGQKTKKSSSANKRSLRARIRAFVSEPEHDQKRRVPRLKRTLSIHHLEPSADWGKPIIFLHKNVDTGASKFMNYNKHSENPTCQEENSESEELAQQKKFRENSTDHEDNEYVDILEMLKVNEDLLQNTDGQQFFNKQARLTKSGSFPAAYSATGKSFRPSKLEHKQTENYSFPKREKLVLDTRVPKLVSSKSGPLFTDDSANELNKGSIAHIRRISSLRESTDKYSQLFECSSSRLPKLHMSKSLRLTDENEIPSGSHASRFFRRILSFPHADNSFFNHSQELQDEKEPGSLPVITNRYIGINYEEGPDYVNSIIARDELSPRAEYLANSSEGIHDIDCPEMDAISEVLSGFSVGKSSHQKEQEEEEEEEETSIEVQPTAVFVPESCLQDETRNNAEFQNLEGPDFRCNSLDKNEYEHSSLDISSTEIVQHSYHNENPDELETAKQCIKSHIGIKSCEKDDDFTYVRDILELSGFITNGLTETWYSCDHPLNPSLFEELEYRYPYEPECFEDGITTISHHLLLFDLVDEVLFDLFEKSYTYYPKALSSSCHVHPVPVGQHFVDEVWAKISGILRSKKETKQFLDLNCVVSHDLGKNDGWMNLQFDSESLALELEELILDELLGEIFCC